MAKKYYAIKKGRDNKANKEVKDLVVTTWDECLLYVKGVKGAVYKSFTSNGEAVAYLSENSNLKKGEDEYPEDIPHIYVDGSYNSNTGEYGYGVVVVLNNEIVHASYGKGLNKESNQRQVNGELQGALTGVEFAASEGYNRVVLFYDYAGVCQHATGAWERNNSLSEEYYRKINELKEKSKIEIIFVKVDSHTGDLFNDIADELAKTGAGVPIEGVTNKAVKKEKLHVTSKEIKAILLKLIGDEDKILVKGEALKEGIQNEEEKTVATFSIERIKAMSEKEREKFLNKLKKEELKKLIYQLIK